MRGRDLDLALDRVRLPHLVERHHDDAGAVALDPPRLLEELLLALLEADRVDDPLALDALQPRLEHRETRAVDHDRDSRDFRLGREQVEERRHRLLPVEQVGVHVDVEDVGAAAHLLERDVDRTLVVAASIRRRKRAEPVTFVRSPIITKPVSGPISNGSRPLKRGRAGRFGRSRGGRYP